MERNKTPITPWEALDIEALYQEHLKLADYSLWPSSHWDARAKEYARTVVLVKNPYTDRMLREIEAYQPASVLDVGCGPGTLALPLAKAGCQVVAMDYSPGMLSVLKDLADESGVKGITLQEKAWESSWDDVPVCDVAVASRSTLVGNLTEMIDKLTAHARKRVIVTAPTSGSFFPLGVYEALNVAPPVGYPTYPYLVMLLMQKGLYPTVDYIHTPPKPEGGPFEDVLESVQGRLGVLEEEQKRKLYDYWRREKEAGRGISRGQSGWALVSWSPR